MKKIFKKGSVLVYALGIIAFVSILLLGLVSLITSQVRVGYDAVAREKAFQIVESCSHEYRWYLAHNTDGHTIEEVEDFWNSTDPLPRGLETDGYEWETKTQSGETVGKCKAKITNAPITASKPIVVEFEGWSPEKAYIKKRTKIRFRRTSWSDYVVLSNEYANFDSKWEIKGKIMSNAGVRFDGVSHGRVYAGSSSYYDPNVGANKPGVWSNQPFNAANNCEFNSDPNRNSCVFLGGKRYPVPQKDFNGIAVDLNAMKNAAQYPGNETINRCNYNNKNNCYFNIPEGKAGKHLTFRNDGKFEIVTVKDIKSNSNDIKSEEISSRQIFSIPQEGIIFVGGNLWIDGAVNNNRVTVVAGEGAGDIYIGSGDLKYMNKDGKDVIGLIAKGNILLTSEKKNCTGDDCKNLEIDAAMVAKDGKIGKENFNPNCCGSGCEAQKNIIDVYGSIVSNKFVEFTISKTCTGQGTARMGFETKNIKYDNYLYTDPPPFFPSDVYYTVDLWEEI